MSEKQVLADAAFTTKLGLTQPCSHMLAIIDIANLIAVDIVGGESGHYGAELVCRQCNIEARITTV